MNLKREAVHESASSTRRSSSPPTSSVSFSCDVTTIHIRPRPTRPRLCTTAWRSSIFPTSRATNRRLRRSQRRDCARAADGSSALAALGKKASADVRTTDSGLLPAIAVGGIDIQIA